jgi:putative PIN family toxin of toxin-antitoxin system
MGYMSKPTTKYLPIALENDSIYAINVPTVVIDTNVFVAALRSEGGASRQVLRLALSRRIQPVFGNSLWFEYEDLLSRDVWGCETDPDQRSEVLAALASVSRWVRLSVIWRPNLPDEDDNHLIELAVAGGAMTIITHNLRDVGAGELKFDDLLVMTPAAFLARFFKETKH